MARPQALGNTRPMPTLSRIFCLALAVLFAASTRGETPGDHHALIQGMFPKATLIADKDQLGPFPAWTVYQLNEVIGYAFETNDLVDFPGFSGERINLLIGIDSAGNFAGLELLHHHEPIFLHGLGVQPLLDFIGQYRGRSVADRIIVGGPTGGGDGDAVYFDGVTRATVSVIVANDTILTSALKVAREQLAEYAQRPPAAVRYGHFEPRDWQGLLAEGLVRRWRIGREEVEAALGSPLADFPDEGLDLHAGADHITLYYAYLNPPTVGRNLLGQARYRDLLSRLRPGEHAFALMSEGFYSYLPVDYRPGTVPDRIALIQNGLPIGLRDTNFYESGELNLAPLTTAPANLRIFRTRPQAGFDPSAPMRLELTVELARNHLVRESVQFSDDYALPGVFFEPVADTGPAPVTPPWVRIWQSRAVEIALLLIGLLVLTIAFAGQRRLTRHPRRLHAFRWAFLGFTLLFVGFYAQGQLSVVNLFTLQLALRDGFDLGVFLLDPIIFILWLYTFASLFVFGRGLFCGWLCPFGALQEALAWSAARLGLRQVRIRDALHRRLLKLKYLILFGLLALAFYSLGYAEKAAEIEPFKTVITLGFLRHWPFALYAVLVLGAGLYIHKFYCRYLCPLGAGLAVLGKFHLFEWLSRRGECGSPCQLCHHRCEIGAIGKRGGVDYGECIQCLECLVIVQDVTQCAPEKAALKRTGAKVEEQVVQWVPAPANSRT